MATRPIPVIRAQAPFPSILTPHVRDELSVRLLKVERRLNFSKQGISIRTEGMAPRALGHVMLRWLKELVVEAGRGFMDALKELEPALSEPVVDRTVRQIREFVSGQIECVLYRFEIHVVLSDDDDPEYEYAKEAIREEGSCLGSRFELRFLDWVRDHPELAPDFAKEVRNSGRKTPRGSAARRPGRPPKAKPDELDRLVKEMIRNGDVEQGRIPVKALMEKYRDRLPAGTGPEKLRSRFRRELDRRAQNRAVQK